MTPDRLPGVEHSEQEPINRLIQIGRGELPDHFKANRVEDGRVLEDIDKGRVEMSVVALPPEDQQSGLGRFWNRVKTFLRAQSAQISELPPIPVAARPKLFADEYTPGKHVQLMGHMPYVVLEDGTRYGIAVSVPAGLQGEWEDFEAPVVNDGGFSLSTEIEIGRKRRGLAVVVRTDDGQPLTRQNLGTTKFQSFQEMLSGGFQPVESNPSREQLLIQHRTTVGRGSSLGVGEEREDQSIRQALLFSALGSNKGVGTIGDRKGRIEVVVYEVIERQVSEIVKRPLSVLIGTRGGLGDLFGDSVMKGGGTFRGGFSAGETSFGKETRKKVNVQGVIVEKPLAAFQVVLVGELPEQEMEMVTNPDLRRA